MQWPWRKPRQPSRPSTFGDLIGEAGRIEALLRAHGILDWADALSALIRETRGIRDQHADVAACQATLEKWGAFYRGGMGSFTDVTFSHLVPSRLIVEESARLNKELDGLRLSLYVTIEALRQQCGRSNK